MKLIGNKNVYEQLSIASKSAIIENRPLPHTLLSGSAGCGKTSTAKKIADVLGCKFLSVAYGKLKTRDDILNMAKHFDRTGYDRYGNKIGKIRPSIIFIDEIHGLNITSQESIGIMMEEWYISIDEKQTNNLSNGGSIRWVPQFTLIGATTNDGLLSKPFRDRFKLRFLFNTYSVEESYEIIKVHTDRLNKIDRTKFIDITDNAVVEIAKRGRGVPRIIVGLLERCRDFAITSEFDIITVVETDKVFDLLGIDETGLTPTDIKLLLFLYKAKSPVGVDNLSVMLNESKQVLLDVSEPYLIQRGLINRTPRGRTLTEMGREYLIEKNHIKIEDGSWVDIPSDYRRIL